MKTSFVIIKTSFVVNVLFAFRQSHQRRLTPNHKQKITRGIGKLVQSKMCIMLVGIAPYRLTLCAPITAITVFIFEGET